MWLGGGIHFINPTLFKSKKLFSRNVSWWGANYDKGTFTDSTHVRKDVKNSKRTLCKPWFLLYTNHSHLLSQMDVLHGVSNTLRSHKMAPEVLQKSVLQQKYRLRLWGTHQCVTGDRLKILPESVIFMLRANTRIFWGQIRATSANSIHMGH